MNRTKLFLWKLADLLHENNMRVSGEELASILNRNNILTSYGSAYAGKRGTYKLIKETWNWFHNDLGLPEEAEKIERTFVKPDGTYAYEQ